GAPTTANAAAAPAAPVDLNAADAVALTSLPGIGPVLAERIVAYRDSVGRFGDVDALMAVKGVGEATLERIRASVTVGW
ncbi:MAG TPA: helix-hairpin-helix domain-containing protein, partial [Longimicrobiales bacterium]|nr:helix-hairpin-helix domain-containing protein [Longimicrobiales bacterium]